MLMRHACSFLSSTLCYIKPNIGVLNLFYILCDNIAFGTSSLYVHGLHICKKWMFLKVYKTVSSVIYFIMCLFQYF